MTKPLSIEISSFSHLEQLSKESDTLVLLVDDKGTYGKGLEEVVCAEMLSHIKRKYSTFGERFSVIDTLIEPMKGFERLSLFSIGEGKDFEKDDWVKLGGALHRAFNNTQKITVLWRLPIEQVGRQQLVDFLLGLKLAHYRFEKYFTKKQEGDSSKTLALVNLCSFEPEEAKSALKEAEMIANSVCFARDLVNEPANILNPEEFAKRAETLSDLGVKVKVLEQKALEAIGMHALLGVARGSVMPPKVVIMEWQGGKAHEAPIAFVGKGVVFDSGGISLKPGSGMEDMKGDMGGAAAVVGLMKLVAQRQLDRNIVGVIGVVENMPDGNALRPGDIITSLSGQTIEIVNTDAEGRLVLADILHYTQKEFSPSVMINLATLTGAIMVALGQQNAGLFSNNDKLAEALFISGQKTGEQLWRMPLSKEYDALLKSRFADMRNSCGRLAGAITAAQFLHRFVGDVAWAHLDVAGTAMDSLKHEYNQSWASGFGVRLLDKFLESWKED